MNSCWENPWAFVDDFEYFDRVQRLPSVPASHHDEVAIKYDFANMIFTSG
ncbi:unnamed protein product [Haemonchus placei]|uniref:Uncharacterized protein n=1 Tax=Haemonchus placei TaxID=6290 RepID=A0A3P7XZV6_HAEPC|nr:unnamed protein product [Haemonchus placei]